MVEGGAGAVPGSDAAAQDTLDGVAGGEFPGVHAELLEEEPLQDHTCLV